MTLFFALVKIAWRNVVQNRRKSAIALLAIASGYMSLNLFQGYIAEAEIMFEETYSKRAMLGDIVIQKETDGAEERLLLDEHDQRFINHFLKSDESVDVSVRFLNVSGMATNGKTSTVFSGTGYDVVEGARMREPVWGWNAVAGLPLERGLEHHVLLGQALGAILDCRPVKKERFLTGTGGYKPEERPFECHSNRLQLSVATVHGQLNASDVEVLGLMDAVFRDVDLRFVRMPLPRAQALLDTKGVSLYSVALKHDGSRGWSLEQAQDAFIGRFREAAATARVQLDVRPWEKSRIAEYYVKSMNFLYVFRDFIVVVIVVIALLSVLNTLIRIVQERTREIGTLRSIGFKSHQVKTIFLLEAFFLAVIGVIVGWFSSAAVAQAINAAGILYKVGVLSEAVPFRIWPTWTQSLQSAAILIAIAVVASYFPTQWAVRKKITECLTF